MKRVIKKISVIIMAVVIIMILNSCAVISQFTGLNEPKELKLDVVTNIAFDIDKYLISWDSVEKATNYIVSINEEEEETTLNELFYIPVENVTEIKIKAKEESGKYKESEWSEIYTYNVSTEEITYSSVYGFVDGMLQGSDKVQKILSMEIKDGYLYTKATYINRKDEPKLYYLQTDIDDYKDLLDITKHQDECFTRTYKSFDLCEQNAMEYLVKSNSFSGKLEEYRQQGYEISIVSSAAGELNTYGALTAESTLKLKKGNDILYIAISLDIIVKNPTGNPKIDYTVKLADPNERRTNATKFVILSGDLYKFAQEMDRVNSLIMESD